MKKLFTSMAVLLAATAVFAAENLFDPAKASIDPATGTYFAPNWVLDPNSTATYDAATGTINVHIASQLSSQWQGQVKLNHNVAFSAAKKYTLSCKFKSTVAVGGVTVKMDDNAPIILNNGVNLPANAEFVFTEEGAGMDGNNQILVFDFGWAAPCDIVISEISITESGEAEIVEHPAPAPAPTLPAEQVFSIYSDAYTSTVQRVTGGWSQTTIDVEVNLSETDKAFYLTKANYLGWELNGSTTIGDMSKFPMLHMDVYAETASSIKFTPIWGADALKEYTLVAGWNGIDIDLAKDFPGINLQNIFQLKWDGMPATCYIDNVYFYNNAETGIVDAALNTPARKVLKNGVLYIQQGEQVYTVLGTAL